MSNPIQIVKGRKLDARLRPMYFVLKNGKKVRIGEQQAIALMNHGAMLVDEFSKEAK